MAMAGLLIWLRRDVVAWISQWRSFKQAWHQAGRLGKFLAACITLTLFFTLLSSLSPPFHFDALTYHLVLPRLYLEAGRFYYVPQNMYWGMPQTAEMLYTWAMALAGDPAAAALGWAIGVLTLAAMLGFGLQKLDVDAAWVAAACLVSGYTGFCTVLGLCRLAGRALGVCWLAMLDVWVNIVDPDTCFWQARRPGVRHKIPRGLDPCGVVAMIYTAGHPFAKSCYILQYGRQPWRLRPG
jgi:hypothetical protein